MENSFSYQRIKGYLSDSKDSIIGHIRDSKDIIKVIFTISYKEFIKVNNKINLSITTGFGLIKRIRTQNSILLKPLVNLGVLKYQDDLVNSISIASAVEFAISYFRKLGEVDNLTFAEIDDWTMNKFDIVEGA